MGKALSAWSKQAKYELINRDMSIAQLAEKIGMSSVYTSAVIHGRIYSKPAVKLISNVLNIPEAELNLSSWCKQARCELIRRDMSITQLAQETGMSREYTSAVVNGRVYSKPAVKLISDVLNISETAACS